MDDFDFLFRLGEIKLRQDEIQRLETAASQNQGIMQVFLQAQANNVKQTVEVIKLTGITIILTIGLFIIGLAQLYFMIVKP